MRRIRSEALAVLGVSLAAAIGIAVVSGGDKSEGVPAIVGAVPGSGPDGKLDPTLIVDSKRYHEAIKAVKGNELVVDLLTAPVPPGENVTTGTSMPLGTRPGDVELVGDAVGLFTIDAVTWKDNVSSTWIEVTATNTGPTPRRLTALVEYTEAPP